MKDSKGYTIKVGDRVRLASIRGYHESRVQGLFVGNLGTVREIGTMMVYVETDANAHSPGYGWPFTPKTLARVGLSKWEKPGRYEIKSYRSFRRYKAAGAIFVRPYIYDVNQDVELTPAQALYRAKRLHAGYNGLTAIID